MPKITVNTAAIIATKTNIPAVFPDAKMCLVRTYSKRKREVAAHTKLGHLAICLKDLPLTILQ